MATRGYGFASKRHAERVGAATQYVEGMTRGSQPTPTIDRNPRQRTGGVAKLSGSLSQGGSAQAIVQKLVNGALADIDGATITIYDCDTLDSSESLDAGSYVFYRWIPGGYVLDGWRCREVS